MPGAHTSSVSRVQATDPTRTPTHPAQGRASSAHCLARGGGEAPRGARACSPAFLPSCPHPARTSSARHAPVCVRPRPFGLLRPLPLDDGPKPRCPPARAEKGETEARESASPAHFTAGPPGRRPRSCPLQARSRRVAPAARSPASAPTRRPRACTGGSEAMWPFKHARVAAAAASRREPGGARRLQQEFSETRPAAPAPSQPAPARLRGLQVPPPPQQNGQIWAGASAVNFPNHEHEERLKVEAERWWTTQPGRSSLTRPCRATSPTGPWERVRRTAARRCAAACCSVRRERCALARRAPA